MEKTSSVLTPHDLRLVRRSLCVGRGALLGLDELGDDIVDCVVHEYGAPNADEVLDAGTCVLEVWTRGDAAHVFDVIAENKPAGVIALAIVRAPTWRTYRKARVRWRRWRVRRALARALRRLGIVRPTYFGDPVLRAPRGHAKRD